MKRRIDWGTWLDRIKHGVLVLFMVFVWGLIGVSFASAIANESNRITEGVVIDKDYDSPYTTYNSIKSGDVTIRVPQYHSETFSILLEGTKDGETVTYWKEVTGQEYADYNIGDWYPKGGK